MQTSKCPCGISLEWIYERVKELQSEAQANAHKKFLAARLIQKIYRGYQVRRALQICRRTSINIQRHYRGYKARRQNYFMLQDAVEEMFLKRYNYYATVIQKWFRGYYSRKYVHDFSKLRDKQRKAAKELILCVAHKLHHLLRTRQIPGVYSLRNSHCLSQVEELLASLRFKEYNEQVRLQRAAYRQTMAAAPTTRKKGIPVKLTIPFGRQCQEVYKNYTTEKMHSVLDNVDKKKVRHVPPKPNTCSPIVLPDDGIYAKVVSSVERFNIVKLEDMSVCPTILQRPEKIEQFCHEMTNICRKTNLYV